jgi:hypothetical protein
MAIGDVYRATNIASMHSQLIETVTHWQAISVGTGNGQAELAASLSLAFKDHVKPSLHLDFAYVGTLVQRFFPGPPLFAVQSIIGNGIGDKTGEPLPTSSAVVIKKRTAFAGRKYRGRIFQAGISTDDIANSAMKPTPLGVLVNGWGSYLSNKTNGAWTWKPILWHVSTNTGTDILTLASDGIVRVRRRREVGVGR